METLDDVFVLREVQWFNTNLFSPLEPIRDAIDTNDTRSTLQLREFGDTETNWTETLRWAYVSTSLKSYMETTAYPDANNVSRVDTGVHDVVIGGTENVGQVESLFVGYLIRDRKEVDVALRYSDIFSLSTSKPTSEVGVAKEAGITMSVHGVLQPERWSEWP